MNAEITLSADTVLNWTGAAVAFCFVTWSASLINAWIEVRDVRKQSRIDQLKITELAAKVSALEAAFKETHAGKIQELMRNHPKPE